ncbi:MAG: hypothetical protein ACRD2E_11010 [Terriglobales bacterium]
MSAGRRPVSVTVIALLYIALGAVSFALQFRGLLRGGPDSGWIELVEALAVVAGAYLLRGANWARWLAVAWMAFHVAISYPVVPKLAVHGALLAVIAWLLFRPAAGGYFRRCPAAAAELTH